MPSNITPPTPATWTYAEHFTAEDEVTLLARQWADELGVVPVGPGAGAVLTLLARAIGARTAVEIGTGSGVSGLALLKGLTPDGVLTSVDIESEHQRAARDVFARAGFRHTQTRLIAGAALSVLPRLTAGAYDMVFVDGDKREYPEYLELAAKLLRVGGIVAFDNALWHDRVADPAQRDPETVAIRDLGNIIRADERWTSALLPVGDGLLVALRTAR